MNRYFLIIAFACLLLAPLANDIFSFVHFERADENRTFQDSLVLDLKRLDAFPKDCEAYINDNFSFRTPSIELYRAIKTKGFQVSPSEIEKVLIGKNQRYFISGDEKKLYEGEKVFTAAQLDSIKSEWNQRKELYRKKKIQSFWLIAPTALEIHHRELPWNVRKHRALNATQQFVSLMNRNQSSLVTYPMKDLQQQAKFENLYFKLDNHWNELGAYYAVHKFFRNLKVQLPNLDHSFLSDTIQFKKYNNGGYLADQMHLKQPLESYRALKLRSPSYVQAEKYNFPVPEGFPYPDDFEHHFKNPKAKNKQRVLVIRDSFGSDCMPFFAEAFSESLFIFDGWQYGMNKEIIEQFKPDLVIYIVYEPNLIKIIR